MKLRSRIFYLYATLVVVYTGLTLLLPAPAQTLHRYHLSVLDLRLLDITIIIPLAVIWLAGFYGYGKLKAYSAGIRRSRDGRHIDKIADGVLLLVLWLPLSSIVANLLNFVAHKHPSFTATTVVIDNYFNLLVPFVGFVIISIGVEGLASLAKLRLTNRALNILAGVLVGVGVFYSYLVVNTDNRLHSLYHLPLAVVLLTLVIPYIYMWYMGLLAAYKLYLYRRKVAGVVYRKSWGMLAFGISVIIGIQIVLQCIVTLTTQLNKLSLGWLLICIYILLVLIAVGYALIARGAKDLQKIEEV